MSNILTDTVEFIKITLGINVKSPIEISNPSVPVYLCQRYDFGYTTVDNTNYVFVVDKEPKQNEFKAKQLAIQMRLIESSLEAIPIYVSTFLPYQRRIRLVEQKVPFIAPGSQLYVPQWGTLFSNTIRQKAQTCRQLGPLAQVLILDSFYRKNLNQFDTKSVQTRFPYSIPSIGRAFHEIDSLELGTIIPEGRCKPVHLKYTGLELWKKALPFMTTPVLKTVKIAQQRFQTVTNSSKTCTGGESALALKTNLVSPHRATFAVYDRDFKTAKFQSFTVPDDTEENYFLLDIWKYPVFPLANQSVVDTLSLYLQFQSNDDERIQIEIEKMLGRFQWQMD